MDNSLFDSINHLAERTGWAHGFMRWYADNGIVLFAILLLVGYLISRHRAAPEGIAGSVSASAAALIALGIGQIIGNVVDRARPYETLSGIHVLVDRPTDFSFPSDHATTVGAVAAHYPGDVLAGLALGGSVAYSCHRLLTPPLARLVRSISHTPLRWPLPRTPTSPPPPFGNRPSSADRRGARRAIAPITGPAEATPLKRRGPLRLSEKGLWAGISIGGGGRI